VYSVDQWLLSFHWDNTSIMGNQRERDREVGDRGLGGGRDHGVDVE
jgi:hypothetical protein